MKILPVLIAMTTLGATAQVAAQTAPAAAISCVANAAIDPNQVGHTGTDTLTTTSPAPSTDLGHSGTGTDSMTTSGTTAAVSGSTELGHSGTGTDTVTASAPAMLPTAVSLTFAEAAIKGPGTITVTAKADADPAATTETTATCTVSMGSSTADCIVPDGVQFTWSSTMGGSADATVSCKRVRATESVTVSSGDASASFTLSK